jgi:alpha-ketoglutarate-dependent taurine dioxygenase
MNTAGSNKRPLKGLGTVDRKAIRIEDDSLVKMELPAPHSQPMIMQACVDGLDLLGWARSRRSLIDSFLLKHGAILFRNFRTEALSGFAEFVKTISGDPLEYRERSSPRTHIQDNIYTSTEYPSDQAIFLHNENSYAHTWPGKVFFLCSMPPEKGGATPIADCRKVREWIDPAIQERFIRKKILYVRNFNEDVGLPWQTVFGTADRIKVEEQCLRAGYQVEWKDRNGLRTKRIGQVVRQHPRSGEMVWFNHATFFHISTLSEVIREALKAQFSDGDLPNNTFYGDGSSIEPSVLDELRAAYERAKVSVPWRSGDILMVDNLLTAHGREAYSGHRCIHVAMSEPSSEEAI